MTDLLKHLLYDEPYYDLMVMIACMGNCNFVYIVVTVSNIKVSLVFITVCFFVKLTVSL